MGVVIVVRPAGADTSLVAEEAVEVKTIEVAVSARAEVVEKGAALFQGQVVAEEAVAALKYSCKFLVVRIQGCCFDLSKA